VQRPVRTASIEPMPASDACQDPITTSSLCFLTRPTAAPMRRKYLPFQERMDPIGSLYFTS